MQVSEYYRLALEAAREAPDAAINHLPQVISEHPVRCEAVHELTWTSAQSWISHMTAKKLYFEAVSQYRMSQEDLAKQR